MSPRIEATRRTVAKSIAVTAATAGAGGIGYLATLTPTAAAAISVGTIDVPDEQAQLAEGEAVSDIVLAVNAMLSYQVDPAPNAWAMELAVGPDTEAIASTQSGDLSKVSDTREVTLRGSVLEAAVYDAAKFTPSKGETAAVDIPITLSATVYRDGDAVIDAEESVTRTVTVEGPALETTASVGAAGSFTVVVS